jgi:hypothetical protein
VDQWKAAKAKVETAGPGGVFAVLSFT